jgi:hypothetical protein
VTVVLCSWSSRPRTQHDCYHDTKVKPEAATAVIELLMMEGKRPEICWALNKRQDNKLENCCIWLVIYLNCAMMHWLTNLKYKIMFMKRNARKSLKNRIRLFNGIINDGYVSIYIIFYLLCLGKFQPPINSLPRCELHLLRRIRPEHKDFHYLSLYLF